MRLDFSGNIKNMNLKEADFGSQGQSFFFVLYHFFLMVLSTSLMSNDFYHFQDYFSPTMLYMHYHYVIKMKQFCMEATWLSGVIGALIKETSIEFTVEAITDGIGS